MNKSFKEGLSNAVTGVSSFFNKFAQTFVSLLRISVLSSIKVAQQSKHYTELKLHKSCCVLGTGPSLKDDFENERVITEGVDIMCVNLFCTSSLFKTIKPRFYFLLDGALFAPKTERHKQMIEIIISAFNEVDWEMFLVVSSSAITGGELLKGLNNNYIKVLQLNSAEFSGFRVIRHWVYRKGIGMPRCQTVVNFAICAAINIKYENVYLYGADHTWTRDLFVDNDNVVCYGDRHVYNKELTVIKKKENFAELLKCFAMMFDAHYLIEDFSKSQGVTIYNCSSDTFLDAYERKKM